MQKLTTLTSPNPILRKKSQVIISNELTGLQKFIDELCFTMYADNGIGIAAPQVGTLKRLIIVAQPDGPLPLINPQITKFSKQTELGEEGCLSVPGIFGLVKRPTKIKISALDRMGKKLRFEATHLFARVIQHEIDHLNGILFIDKVEKRTSGDRVVL